MCLEILEGFGDASAGEWTEDRPRAFHLRRRLSEKEQERVGQALDCRNTEEGIVRFERIANLLPPPAVFLAREELKELNASR